MARQNITDEAFKRQYAYMLEDMGKSDEEIEKACERNSWTVGELIDWLKGIPRDHLVLIGENGDTEKMTPRFVQFEYDFKDEDESNNEGFVLLSVHAKGKEQ
jgi:hypothetical protein